MQRFSNSMRSRWRRLFRYKSIRPSTPKIPPKDESEKKDQPYIEEGSTTKDVVNSPTHYNQTGIECIDAIGAALGDGFEYYLQGNVMKYLWRYRYKNGIEDLKKAEWYQNKLIEIKERKQ